MKKVNGKTYKVLQEFSLSGFTHKVNTTIFFTTEFKGTNSKNVHYIPEDLLNRLIDKEIIKSLVLCD